MPVSNLQSCMSWERKWINPCRQIIGYYAMTPASVEQDIREATDLIILRTGGLAVACRMRRPGYQKFRYDITITCRRETGTPCEYNKMIEGGFADWLFYGHAIGSEFRVKNVKPYYILDLSVCRHWIRQYHGPELGPNQDPIGRRCWFYKIDIRELFRELGERAFIGSSEKLRELPTTGSYC
jgi:hypothetical protein